MTLLGRDAAIGVASTALALAAMAVDHLLGDDPGLDDPGAFAFSAALVLVVAAVLFGLVVPRTSAAAAPGRAEGSRLATVALVAGAAVLALLTVGYAVQAVGKLA